MNYIFGTVKRNGKIVENLKTVGSEHTALTGYITTTREYDINIITDRCYIVDHYRTDDDAEGNCYDWYEISNHYRYEDKFAPVKDKIEIDALDNLEYVAQVDYRVCLLELGITDDDLIGGEDV